MELQPSVRAAFPSTSDSHAENKNIPLSLLTFGVCFGIYTLLIAAYLAPRNAVENLDYWYQTSIGLRATWTEPSSLVDGFYPIGYPVLLAFAIRTGLDVLRFGQILSWFGGALALIAVFRMTYRSSNLVGASLSILLLLTNFYFLYFCAYEGTDMLSAGLQLSALALLWELDPQQPFKRAILRTALIGTLIGLAYLVRYTALLLVPCAFLVIALHYRRSIKACTYLLGILIGTFFGAAAVQIVPSLLVHHRLFYNTQPKNVWFGIYGNMDWNYAWASVPNTITLGEVIALDPWKFITHCWQQLSAYVSSPPQWTASLHVAWMIGIVVLLFTKRVSLIQWLLLCLFMVLTVGATAMAWLLPRFLITVLVCQALIIAAMAEQITRVAKGGVLRWCLLVALCGVILYGSAGNMVIAWLKTPPRTEPVAVNALLREAGMLDPREVAANDPYLHATDVPVRTEYTQLHAFAVKPTHIDEILQHALAQQWKYLVIDYASVFGDYQAIDPQGSEVQMKLTLLQQTEQQFIFCINPCRPQAQSILNVRPKQ